MFVPSLCIFSNASLCIIPVRKNQPFLQANLQSIIVLSRTSPQLMLCPFLSKGDLEEHNIKVNLPQILNNKNRLSPKTDNKMY